MGQSQLFIFPRCTLAPPDMQRSKPRLFTLAKQSYSHEKVEVNMTNMIDPPKHKPL